MWAASSGDNLQVYSSDPHNYNNNYNKDSPEKDCGVWIRKIVKCYNTCRVVIKEQHKPVPAEQNLTDFFRL